MKCLGTVLAAIVAVAVGFTLLFGAVFGIIFVAEATSDYFGFSSFGYARPLFLFGYMIVIIGVGLGVAACREEQRK